LVQIPFLNLGVSFYDEGHIVSIAEGLQHGEALYRDRVTTIAPLTYELMARLFDLFGTSLLVGRVLQAIVFTVCTVLIHRILRDFVNGPWARLGALAFLALKPLAFPFWTAINYSQIGMLFSLVAVLMVQRYLPSRRPAWLAVAGCAVGLTVLTKQNLGALLGATVAATLIVDARLHRSQGLRVLLRSGGIALAGLILPIGVALLFYCGEGTLGDLIHRAVLGLVHMRQPYLVPFPGLDIWAFKPKELGSLSFAYFPAPVVHLAWQGGLNMYSAPTVIVIEHLIKAIYYLPLALILFGAVLTWWDRGSCPADRCGWLLILMFAATEYLSLYRADWTHLMNIFPPLLLACVVVLERWARKTAWARRAALGLFAIWTTVALSVAGVAFAVYRTPIETARGRILASHAEAEFANAVLAYLEKEAEDEEVVFMRGDPLFYFLTARNIPGRFDLIMPGHIAAGDDEGLAASLAEVDQVIYNPAQLPTVTMPITEYAPRTAALLARGFRVVKIIHPTALALKPIQSGASREVTVLDFWEDFERIRPLVRVDDQIEPGRPDQEHDLERTSWIMYRVIASAGRPPSWWSCFGVPYRVDGNEEIAALPLSHPREWKPAHRSDKQIVFEIRARSKSAGSTPLYSEVLATSPPERIRVSLAAFRGEEIELQFCSGPTSDTKPEDKALPRGWAELRIVRPSQSS
jgi:hypothetical protein